MGTRRRTGRRNYVIYGAIVIALAITGCRGKRSALVVHNEEEPAALSSVVKMNDVRTSPQLLSGFYSIEAGAWRWTSGKFSVQLATPVAAVQNGARLTFNFTIPDVVKKNLDKVTLSAAVNDQVLGSSTYQKAGPAVFTADLAAGLLTKDAVKIDFSLDKDLPPNTIGDARELGIVANSVSLASK